ncbi:MAG: SsrA-binding protein [Bacteroidetes bacterium]|nr:MAG: SsrA-binding protein [Bacteroidota bacterium]
MSNPNIEIKNRRASFEFSFLEKFVAGLVLVGTEIKSIREGKANITEAFCVFEKDELWLRNAQVDEYEKAKHYNHNPRRDRKLLLTKHELRKLQTKLKDQGLTIIPLRLFLSEKGLAKLEIALAKGKKLFDKREDIKKRDMQRETNRKFK